MRARVLLAAVLVCGLVASACAVAFVGAPPGVDVRSSVPGESASSERAEPSTSAEATPGDVSSAQALACPVAARSDDSHRNVSEARIVELYPNPTTPENVGEFFVLETPPETSLENWTVTDGHTTASFPNETVSGAVAVTINPNETASLTDEPTLELEGHLRLATDGDRLEIRNGSDRIDAVSYEDAPVAEQWYRTERANESGDQSNPSASARSSGDATGRWWPRGATCLPSTRVAAENATTFVLPDSPEIPLETIRNAEENLSLAGYTFTSEAVASELVAASERGVEVDVLLESGPVGGASSATEAPLSTLEDGGVDVRMTGGENARYRYHHPKYAIADDTVLIMTENWKPSGVGGESSRGWGISLENTALATDLETVFDADFSGPDTESGTAYLEDASFSDPAGQVQTPTEFPSNHPPESVDVESAELLLAPDNAEPRLRELLASAEDEILVKQASLGGPDVSLVEETVDAARRGVEVRILLDSSWYVEEENARVKSVLEETAAAEDLPLEVALVEPKNRFEKIHAKGVVIDGETTVVGSINWNDNSLRNNREVVLAIHGEEPAAYYEGVFDADWNGGTWSLPVGLAAVVALALLGAAALGRRYISFGDSRRPTIDGVGRDRLEYDEDASPVEPPPLEDDSLDPDTTETAHSIARDVERRRSDE
ncbi:phospholipase D-like domain-containing protein [Halostagnicola kamekurae]|uniref:Phosphatidylserine/phosphatidylglycerophosphate/cardiolipin synthase n=1 Tax=Halostagnicola kamekurae TaxID=619731 RepID=A0A1I6S560_9EURY|nr:phospholipase D-like domain-containing protein [Halostagnicola kamekurae]SFS71908.1 Phosphatidylserine/phosphatidylglycerophosphate/cardiolipin synthase [Halostagnicola kamekurae]